MSVRDRVAGFRSGLVIGDHTNNQDFWGILFGRPTAFVLLVLVGDWRIATPNRITHASNLLLIAGCIALFMHRELSMLWAAILINLSLTFDCADGQLARYRRSGSPLGSYYDKASDAVGLVLLFSAVGWVAFERHGDPLMLLLAVITTGGVLTQGYAKWLAQTTLLQSGQPPAKPAPPTKPIPLAQYPLRIFIKLFRFAEPDMLMWIGIGLILDRLDLTLWLMAISQAIIALVAVSYRARQIARMKP